MIELRYIVRRAYHYQQLNAPGEQLIPAKKLEKLKLPHIMAGIGLRDINVVEDAHGGSG